MAALVRELQAENAQLRALLKGMAHQAFGSRSERASAILGDQGILDLGDLVTTPAAAANDDGDAEDKPAAARPRRKRGVMALPAHIERVIDPDTLDCLCCAGKLHRIGEDASEALDWIPASFASSAQCVLVMPARNAGRASFRRRHRAARSRAR
ncbi:IS66 family transposase zinc-finger binding domain-containing protein [Novosphingobium sp. AP12]|uniref:IS66 family transposase n=1 Tax=Novosphingobium sp. AP12 TaxID=1144305 RepID=UPI0035105107